MCGLTVSQSVISDVVAWRIHEDKEDGKLSSSGSFGGHKPLHRHCPANIAAKQRGSAGQVHLATGKAAYEERYKDGVDEGPAVEADVELALEVGVGISDQLE